MNKESSLTTPQDRDLNNKWKPDRNPPLTAEQTDSALEDLNDTSLTSKNYPKLDRAYVDPPVPMQNIGLFSFVPSKDAKPDKNGIYGFAKMRGNYGSELEANQRAEFLIRNADSYHKIFHAYVGKPFPVTCSSDFSSDTQEVDLKKEMVKTISNDLKQKKIEEQQSIQEIKKREEALLEESRKAQELKDDEVAVVDPYENYITLRVKKAQLQWTYLEHQKKMQEVRDIIIRTREDIEELDEEYPDFKDKYLQKYLKAREDSGIKESDDDKQNNFMKFLVEDADLDF